MDKRKSLFFGWTLFLTATLYLMYIFLGGLYLAVTSNSDFTMPSAHMKGIIVSLGVFFIGVYFLYKGEEKK